MIDRITLPSQIEALREFEGETFTPFKTSIGGGLKSTGIDIFQMNIGKMCNQTCQHCHVDAGPDRKEIMTRETMAMALEAIEKSGAHSIDLTGGAPEMNPNFYWFVEQASRLDKKIMVRSNLTILQTNKHRHAPKFFADHKVEVISSLPYYKEQLTDSQRGSGVFQKSIAAIKELNAVGYGKPDSGLVLNLVYNPVGAYLPPNQANLEKEYKAELRSTFGIEFNQLFCITNMPISRYLEYLIATDNYAEYMDLLIESYNPAALESVMCRNTISVSWDGFLYDCDFNQMLEMPVSPTKSRHLKDFNLALLAKRDIVLANHCYGCTAGAGSSCGGTLE